MKLIVGLGNPGAKYERHRHNVGFIVVDEIARQFSFDTWRKKFQGQVAEGQINTTKCLLLKPETYMNDSGFSVGEALRFYKLDLEDVFVFHDEIDLKPGKIRVKTGGGSAGHNGLKSITSQIGNDYVRVRIGVGHPGRKDQVYKYVLQNFSKADQDWLPEAIEAMAKAATHLADDRADKFMNEVARVLGNNDDKQQGRSKPKSPDKNKDNQKKRTEAKDANETSKSKENSTSPSRSDKNKEAGEDSPSGILAEKLRALLSRNSEKN